LATVLNRWVEDHGSHGRDCERLSSLYCGRERGPPPNLRAYPAAGAGSQFRSTLRTPTRTTQPYAGPSHQRPILLRQKAHAMPPCAILISTGAHALGRAKAARRVQCRSGPPPYPPALQLLSTNEAKLQRCVVDRDPIGCRACMRSPARPCVRCMVYL
jgi:hypothetical protein